MGEESACDTGDAGHVGLILNWEDPLAGGLATTPVFLPGESSWTEEPGGLQSTGLQKSDMTEATEHA